MKLAFVAALATLVSQPQQSHSAHDKFRRNPWRSLQGLGASAVSPHHIDEKGKHFEHNYVHDHPELGTTRLSYTAVIPHHVRALDDFPAVLDLTCHSQSSLTIHTTEEGVELYADLKEGDIVIASSGFGCHTHQPSGRDHGRHLSEDKSGGHSIIRRVLKVGDFLPDEEEEGTYSISLDTAYAEVSDALLDSDIDFTWTPPHHGEDALAAAHARHEINERRHLLDLDTLIDSCKDESTLDFTGNANIKCELNEHDLFDFYADLFSVNYNPVTKGAKQGTLYALQDTVRCDDCYAALNLEISAQLKTSNYDLDKFKVTVSGSVHAQTAVTVTDPTEHIEAFLNRAFEELGVGGCMQTIEFWVSYVPIRIKPCWDMAVEFESSADIQDFSVRSGFVFDANATVGVEYVPASGGNEASWQPVKDWNWDLDFYQPLWHTTGLTTDSMLRFYVIPEMTFTVVDIIPLLVYPKPYLGLGFKERTSDTVARTPSEGQGTWKVYVEKGNGFSDNDEISPDVYVVAEILGCTSTAITAEVGSANLLYSSQRGGANVKANTATTTPIVTNPGCKLQTTVDWNDANPEWNQWLIFENAPMFRWEAMLDERVKISVWDSEDGNWFDQKDDLLAETTYNALAAAGDDVVHTQTLDLGGGKSLNVVIKWELWNPTATNALVNGFAPEPVDGCWRPDGVSKCEEFHDMAMRRLDQTCSVDNTLTTCECDGLNAHLNYGFDIEIGVGEIDLPFEITLEGYDSGMQYKTKRLFAGIMVELIVMDQADLVCVNCEGCVAVLADGTSSSGWAYSRAIDPSTGKEVGWIQDGGGEKGAWFWVGIGGGIVAFVALAVFGGVYIVKRRRAVGGDGGEVVGSWLGFKAGTGGAKRGSAYIAKTHGAIKSKRGSSTAQSMQMQKVGTGTRGSVGRASGTTGKISKAKRGSSGFGGNDRDLV